MHNKNETAALLRAGRQLSLGLAGRSRVLRLFPSALLATEAGLPRLRSPLVRLQPGFRIALRACTHTRNQSPAIVPVAGSGQRKVSLGTSFHLPITSRSCPVLDIEFALSLQLELNRFLRVESDPVQRRISPPDAGTPFRRTPTGYSGNQMRGSLSGKVLRVARTLPVSVFICPTGSPRPPVVRNQMVPDSSSGSAIYDSRERTVLMRPSCIQ